MRTHKANKSRTAKPVTDPCLLRTWCGLELPNSRVTLGNTDISCQKCLKAFAAVLRSLPDAFPAQEPR